MRRRLLVAVLGVLLMGASASAQPVVNPTTVVFTPSADHSLMTSYEFGYFTTAADAVPIRKKILTIADLRPVGADVEFTFPRMDFGSWTHKLRACTNVVVCSEWVQADRTSDVRPFPPTVVRVQ